MVLRSTNTMPKVALGMSGGVDSSLCTHLLVEQGYDVTGVYLECWRAPGCRTEEDRKDALAVALSLDIPFTVLDFKETYRQKVVENFFTEYAAGRTPNPDVLCNKEIKFGLFYDWAMEHGFDFVATGHYAEIVELPTQTVVSSSHATDSGTSQTASPTRTLAIPKDTAKDQTYFLYLLTKDQLEQVLFPLAGYTKQEVRILAKEKKLSVADKKDSVGICFIGDINVHEFLRDRLGENPGAVVNTKGEVIGTHQGLWFYTIGQRHGFTIQAKSTLLQADGSHTERQNIPPFYVIAKNPDKNELVVGFGTETLRQEFLVTSPHWLVPNAVEGGIDCLVRIRHTGALLPCNVVSAPTAKDPTALQVTLKTPIKGLAEGQSAVLYQEKTISTTRTMLVLGGGVIRP